jgi:hypothetical protein
MAKQKFELKLQYSAQVIDRAAKRMLAATEDPDVAPGVYDLDFFRERVPAHPEDYIRDEDYTDGVK